MSVLSITKENFNEEVLTSQNPVLLDFWAGWCGPCKMLSPIVNQIADQHPEIKVGKVNVDEQPDLARQFQIMGIPTLLLFKDGKPVATSVGLKSKSAIENLLK